MTTFQIDVDDDLARVLDDLLPDGVDPDDWLSAKAEEAIAVAKVRQNSVDLAAAGGVPDDVLVTNDDVQAARDASTSD